MCTPRGDLVNRPSCTSTTTSTYLTPRPPCRPSDHRSDATSPTAESELSLEELCGGRCCPDLSPYPERRLRQSEISDPARFLGAQARRNRPWWGIRGRFRFFAESPGSKGPLVKVSSAEWVRRWRRPRGARRGTRRCVDADSGCGHSGHPGSCCESPGSGATSAFKGPAERRPEFKIHPKRTNADNPSAVQIVQGDLRRTLRARTVTNVLHKRTPQEALRSH